MMRYCVILPAFIVRTNSVIKSFGKATLLMSISRSVKTHGYISNICRSAIGNILVKSKCYQMLSIYKNVASLVTIPIAKCLFLAKKLLLSAKKSMANLTLSFYLGG